MYPRSADFDSAVRYGGEVVTTIDAYRAGQLLVPDLPWVRPSSVTVDEGASAWRSAEITVEDMDLNLIPKTPGAALAPYGTDLFVRTGFKLPSGVTEQVPMGVFRILTGRPTRKGRITLLAYDYSRVVARARFERPRVFPKGYSRALAIYELISERIVAAGPVGHTVLSITVSDDSPLPVTVFEEGERYGDPWKACVDMAEAGGLQIYFNPTGPLPTAILRVPPDIGTAPVSWYYDDAPGSTKVDLKPEQDTTTGYNVYVVTGESSELASTGVAPVRASAEITDPESPIYPGTYGRVPTFFASPFIRTTDQAQQVANANLPIKAGGSERMVITGFPHPAHEAGDVVWAVDEPLGMYAPWVISRFTMPLDLASNVDYACRAKRVT